MILVYIQRTNRQEAVLGELVGFFFEAEDGIRDLVRSRGLGDVYKRQVRIAAEGWGGCAMIAKSRRHLTHDDIEVWNHVTRCLLYTSDAADDQPCVDLGGRRIITKKTPPPAPPRPR